MKDYKNNIRLKTDLYLISLLLLFLFFIILTVDIPIYWGKDWCFIGTFDLVKANIIPIFCIVIVLYCLYALQHFNYILEGSAEIPFEIIELKGINYEHLTFLATYVIPLISFDFHSNRQLIVLVLLLIIMGVIYIKTDLFYANPSLALVGFHIYEASGNFKTGQRSSIILLSKSRLKENEKVKYIKLDERIYFVKEVKNDN